MSEDKCKNPECQEPEKPQGHIPDKVEPIELVTEIEDLLASDISDRKWICLAENVLRQVCEIITGLQKRYENLNAINTQHVRKSHKMEMQRNKLQKQLKQAEGKRHISITQAREMALFQAERSRERQKWTNAQEENKQLQKQLAEAEESSHKYKKFFCETENDKQLLQAEVKTLKQQLTEALKP